VPCRTLAGRLSGCGGARFGDGPCKDRLRWGLFAFIASFAAGASKAARTCASRAGQASMKRAGSAPVVPMPVAARALGIGESTLRGRLKRRGIEAPKRRRGRKARAATAA
jgi:hypothetical protein